jgi:hypothetical protein
LRVDAIGGGAVGDGQVAGVRIFDDDALADQFGDGNEIDEPERG